MDWNQIDGYLHILEGEKLQELAFGKDVFEIGAFKGRSTVCMASTAKSVLTLDTFKADFTGQIQEDSETTLKEFLHNISESPNITYIIGESPKDIPKNKTFDFFFVDGLHEYSIVRREIEAIQQIARPDYIIAFHDYVPACQVMGAVDDSGLIILGQTGSLVWCKYDKKKGEKECQKKLASLSTQIRDQDMRMFIPTAED